MKCKANNMTIFWGGKAVAYATTAELDVNVDTYEIGSATSGAWRNYKKGRKGWTLSAGHLIDVTGKNTQDTSQRRPFDFLVSDAKVQIAFGTMAEGPTEAKDQTLNGQLYYSGQVLVRRYTVSAVKGQYVSCQFEAVGCGELTEVRRNAAPAPPSE